MRNVYLVTMLFENKISSTDMPLFRGCMIKQSENNLFFHNHNQDRLRYAYPLIQYKRIGGHAAIVGLNEGGEAIEKLAKQTSFFCRLGTRNVEMQVAEIRSEEYVVDISACMRKYEIQRWLPLNADNYKIFQQMERLADRIDMLEHILVGNILSFAKGVNIFFDSPVVCQISQLENRGVFRYKNVELMNFSATFQTNISLPELIGLGKSASINNGVIRSA